MILLSSLLLLVAGTIAVACATDVACIKTVAGILAVAGFLFVPDGFLLMVSLLLLVVLLLLPLAVDVVLPVASVPADPVVTIGISNIGLANSRNYMTISYRIKASIYRTIGYQTQKNYPLPTSEN